ncbi:MAG: CBS domain-containing protein [Candidatus Marinimicrobia bacterium]|nr:CBS domain-containing protein [Candidatus Neomarinimicrobiota bacterium]
MNQPNVKTYMTTRLITLRKDMDVYFAIGLLLKNNISGAPVIDNDNNLCGILSEKDCLRIFANGSFYDMPGGSVSQFMTDVVLTVEATSDLFSVADKFLKHNFRRMPVVKGKKLVGQISRRDVLRAIQDSTNYDMDTEEINGYITQEMKGSLSK